MDAADSTQNPQRDTTEPPQSENHTDAFRRIAVGAANQLGSPWAFMSAMGLVVAWAISGPLLDFDETWQLVINTATGIVTFLMVFLIQATQNRDAKALHLKLDELIRVTNARNAFADLEDASEEELDALQREFERLRKQPEAAAPTERPDQQP